MRYEIIFSAEAEDDFRALKANLRATVRGAIERFLRYEPTKISKSRIKRLRAMLRPQYRLRVGDIRVFYDVAGTTVEVLAVVAKADADAWLERVGERDETDTSFGSEE
jgi:mRNA-degrading endonuclease RelE of RelBE toxin-antitoxin system